jgi:hypothetical protein
MHWDRAIEVQDVRGRWLQVHAMWSRPVGLPFASNFPDVDVELVKVAATLAVVASRAELWEAQAHVVASCSITGADPIDLWSALAGMPFEPSLFQPGALVEVLQSTRQVPPLFAPWSLVWGATVLASNYAPEVLNQTGYVVGQMAGSWEDCEEECGQNPPCILRCLTRGGGAATASSGVLVDV